MSEPRLPPDVEERTWEVVRRAYEERVPAPRSARPRAVVLLAAGAAIVAVAAAASPPGRAVFQSVRKAVGVEHAAVTLDALPARGRLLVVSSDRGGTWIVHRDGSKRRIGDFADATWSPHGLFVAATRDHELLAVDPKGHERWSLARRDVSTPRWSPSGYRIAYRARSGLRVVAGDGTGDRLLAPGATGALAWDPRRVHTLAYADGGSIVVRDVDTGRTLWRRLVPTGALLEWSSDGMVLAVGSASLHRVTVLDATGRTVRTISLLGGSILDGAFAPGAHLLALQVRHERPHALDDARDRRSEVRVVDVDRPGHGRLVVAGPGVFGDLAWSPGGRTLLVDWRTANQWLFVTGTHVRAVANIAAQFPRPDGKPPLLELANRWCCAP